MRKLFGTRYISQCKSGVEPQPFGPKTAFGNRQPSNTGATFRLRTYQTGKGIGRGGASHQHFFNGPNSWNAEWTSYSGTYEGPGSFGAGNCGSHGAMLPTASKDGNWDGSEAYSYKQTEQASAHSCNDSY